MYFISKNKLDKLLQRLIASEIDYNRLRIRVLYIYIALNIRLEAVNSVPVNLVPWMLNDVLLRNYLFYVSCSKGNEIFREFLYYIIRTIHIYIIPTSA